MALDKDILERLGLYAQLVFDETKASANTHTRVGQAFIDTHTLFGEVENDEADIAQLQKDLQTTQDDLSDLDKREREDIEAVNEKIAAILPRLILPLYGIMTDEVTIKTAGILTEGVAVWCAANGQFAWNAKNGSFFTTDYYGTWGAYGIYPDGNMYHSELSESANTEVWYYVQTEGAFYYWNGSAMEKITVIEFATQSDLSDLDKKEKEYIDSVNDALKQDIEAVNDVLEKDIDSVNEKIAAILPRLILPLDRIVTSQVSIHTAGSNQAGRAVWCSANGAFAWALGSGSITTDFYGSWGAYGIYPFANSYLSELSPSANTEVWYYVQAEGAFYYWNGSEMEKITSIDFATQSDLATKQDILKAGEGITIENDTISADLTNIVPTALVLEYPESISLQNLEAKKISASLLPEGIIQNIVFLAKGESLEVGLFGDITLLAAGVTRVRVIPTCNTALAKEISISVLDRPLRLVTASSMRLTGSGNLRFY